MKAREIYESIRTRKPDRNSLRLQLMLLVSAELVVCVLGALGIYYLLKGWIPIDPTLLLFLALLVISLIVGNVVTNFVAKYFFNPIKKLRGAMGKVASGDFSVRLEEFSNSNEIMEVYSGFNLMVSELDATEILQTDFVSNVSHEFKTPINAIEGYSMLLQSGENLTAEQQEYVEKILFNTQRLSTLVGSILLLSKIENQSIPTGKTAYRLDEQIRQSIVALEADWSRQETEFDVELAEMTCFGDEPIMRHVWTNLISNAIKFGPRGGLVTLRLEKQGNCARFTIEDQGPGLPEEAKQHIFDKFYQADSSHKQEGNGLGLALVKKILDRDGGTITAENTPTGCRFTVVLPLQ